MEFRFHFYFSLCFLNASESICRTSLVMERADYISTLKFVFPRKKTDHYSEEVLCKNMAITVLQIDDCPWFLKFCSCENSWSILRWSACTTIVVFLSENSELYLFPKLCIVRKKGFVLLSLSFSQKDELYWLPRLSGFPKANWSIAQKKILE